VKHAFNMSAILIHDTQGVTQLIRGSANGSVACSVLWIRMAVVLNTCFTVCTVKPLLLGDVCKYFLKYSTIFFAN